MAEFKNLETDKIGLIQQSESGEITQIGLTEEQSQMLQYFVASISQDSPLVRMPSEYNLQLKI